MGSFTLTVYHGGRFGYEEGSLWYLGGEKTVIEDVDSICGAEVVQIHQREHFSSVLEKALKLFATDKDALKMCRIVNLRGHVEVFVVHVIEDVEEFPEAGFIDVGGQTEQNPGNELVVYEGEKVQEMENDDGLLPTFDEVIPVVDHRFCVRHLYSNFRKKFSGLQLKQLMWRCAKATHWKDWEREMAVVRGVNVEAHKHLNSIPPRFWSRSRFNFHSKCDTLAQPPKQTAAKIDTRGRKRSILKPTMQSATRGRKRSKAQGNSSSQPQPATSSTPITRSKSSHSQLIPKPITHATRPNTIPTATPQRRPNMKPIRSSTQPPPATKEKGASSSSQPIMNKVSFTHNIALHVSPRKLRLIAKLPPREWGKL
ncbi:hypothetical protein Ahy_B05g078613 [Arachis hypogaea]|uniref:PB1-like domain-containing protein n=1 Tax=Arachis hypogaea TaxID=3818 RepID=A0A444Z7I2_ARAHY|nr:hypothetical protein Ahy_B05g078613 [Arachis hypogaea]